ncbi:YciI family protein [Terrabacter sp. Soil810]|uniref:YciI family protein n=1 Tax=Terrabacter sp. Soil810 TaxID=1736418 RepID=UPI000A41D14B|nr:YciI family protein [Terrabacter sp. Soil810]
MGARRGPDRRDPGQGRRRVGRRRVGHRRAVQNEAREWLGGFWIVEAADLDAALSLAREGSAACGAPVEVRALQAE